MLKFQLDTLDGVDDAVKGLYTEQDGKFILAIDGLPKDRSAEYEERIGKMDAKINELLSEKKDESKKRKDAEELARQEAQELAKKSGDVDALEASWQEKYTTGIQAVKDDLEPKVSSLESLLHDATVTTMATQIASDLAVPGSAKALMPHIQSRLTMEIKDGKAAVSVVGLDGNKSALTTEELKNEFIGDAAFAPLIVGSKASGGGASSSSGGAGTKTLKRADFSTKNPSEQMAFVKDGGTVIDD